MCTATGSSPLCNTQSKGRYSPKSAIHPDAPVSLTMRTMTSSIQLTALGLVRSNRPKETPGSLPRRYTPPWTVRTMYPNSFASRYSRPLDPCASMRNGLT